MKVERQTDGSEHAGPVRGWSIGARSLAKTASLRRRYNDVARPSASNDGGVVRSPGPSERGCAPQASARACHFAWTSFFTVNTGTYLVVARAEAAHVCRKTPHRAGCARLYSLIRQKRAFKQWAERNDHDSLCSSLHSHPLWLAAVPKQGAPLPIGHPHATVPLRLWCLYLLH